MRKIKIIGIVLIAVFFVYIAQKTSSLYEINKISYKMNKQKRFLISLKEALWLHTYYSQSGQDRWVSQYVFKGVNYGYYLDIGSADGERNSNSKYLDMLGWNGICVDPFPSNMENRTCVMYKDVVYSVKGKKISFKTAGTRGGISDHIGSHKNSEKVVKSGTVEFTTTTLDDIIERTKAPSFINYMSLDIEGAELEALKGLSFEKYKIGAITIEHNYEEPRRTEIRKFLETKGYRLDRTLYQDDCYVLIDMPRADKVN